MGNVKKRKALGGGQPVSVASKARKTSTPVHQEGAKTSHAFEKAESHTPKKKRRGGSFEEKERQ